MSDTEKLLEELKAKHREIKAEMLNLMGKVGSPSISKEKISDELFKIYIKVK